jgi:ElaB/YqjD/DUF883 family membrane-anchored ribosome-binding protein
MSRAVQAPEVSEPDLVDRIADSLPAEIRADYYREMRHCRSLPENDEMLRILRIMQFLTLLIHTAPSRLAAERESLDRALSTCADALGRTVARLNGLPQEVAKGIAPEAIAAAINENLRQQFLQSTIPQTADALAVAAARMKKTVADFQQAAASIHNAHRSAAAEANRAIHEIEASVSQATKASQQATVELKSTFFHEYRWSIAMIAAVSLIVGVLFTLAYQNWISSPVVSSPKTHVEAGRPKR